VASMLRPTSKHRVANTFFMLWTTFSMLRTHFSCCAPSLLPWHSVHIASDVTSVWRACCELVASMLRSSSKHQMQGWWAVGRASDFPPVGRMIGSITVYISIQTQQTTMEGKTSVSLILHYPPTLHPPTNLI
jgi:hypothetical protein